MKLYWEIVLALKVSNLGRLRFKGLGLVMQRLNDSLRMLRRLKGRRGTSRSWLPHNTVRWFDSPLCEMETVNASLELIARDTKLEPAIRVTRRTSTNGILAITNHRSRLQTLPLVTAWTPASVVLSATEQ
jgi:hypothetical protein